MSKPLRKKRYYSASLFDIVGKMEQTNASASELRTPIFAPVDKISHNSVLYREFKNNKGIRSVATSWGEITTRGRVLLSQQHRDILDCIYINASEYQMTELGRMRIYFNRRQMLGIYNKNATNNHTWLRQKLEEIRDTAIKYKTQDGNTSDFNIISHIDYSASYRAYCIELDERYVRFYAQDLSIGYQKLLPQILGLENSVIKSIVRFLLSHTHIKISLDNTLSAIGYSLCNISGVAKRKFLKELKNTKEILFEQFNISYNDEFKLFEYEKHKDVNFIFPIKVASETTKELEIEVSNLINKPVTREFFERGIKVTAFIQAIMTKKHPLTNKNEYAVILRFPDNRILEIEDAFPTLLSIKKIID